jgi:hypothetical protein
VPVYALDPHESFTGVLGGEFGPEDRGAFYRNMLASGAYRKVRLINLGSDVVTVGWRRPVGLLWLDGDHSYEGVRADYLAWSPHLLADAVVALDDSTNPDLGPHRLVEELVDAGAKVVRKVGKITAIRRHAVDAGSAG